MDLSRDLLHQQFQGTIIFTEREPVRPCLFLISLMVSDLQGDCLGKHFGNMMKYGPQNSKPTIILTVVAVKTIRSTTFSTHKSRGQLSGQIIIFHQPRFP